jgi:hypothetical protein
MHGEKVKIVNLNENKLKSALPTGKNLKTPQMQVIFPLSCLLCENILIAMFYSCHKKLCFAATLSSIKT